MRAPRPLLHIALSLCCLIPLACHAPAEVSECKRPAPTTKDSASVPTTNPAGAVLQVADLHNVHRLTPTLFCGSVPATADEFKALAAIGIKTVISVDGAKPEADLAEEFGLRYVHLPFGYDGIPRDRELEIARAVRDLPGPIYIHCHHGLHRGPAAAVIAAESAAGWTPDQAVAALQALGTSPQYPGLYAAAKDFHRPTDAELDHADGSFPRVSKLDDLSDTMVAVDQRWDNLKAAQKAGWGVVSSHPDMDPATEALLLKELFREESRLDRTPARTRTSNFVGQLAAAETSAGGLEAALRAKDRVASDQAMVAMQNACNACHTRYRNPARQTEGVR